MDWSSIAVIPPRFTRWVRWEIPDIHRYSEEFLMVLTFEPCTLNPEPGTDHFRTKQFICPLWKRGIEGDFAAH
jgi:hypothetical protein